MTGTHADITSWVPCRYTEVQLDMFKTLALFNGSFSAHYNAPTYYAELLLFSREANKKRRARTSRIFNVGSTCPSACVMN